MSAETSLGRAVVTSSDTHTPANKVMQKVMHTLVASLHALAAGELTVQLCSCVQPAAPGREWCPSALATHRYVEQAGLLPAPVRSQGSNMASRAATQHVCEGELLGASVAHPQCAGVILTPNPLPAQPTALRAAAEEVEVATNSNGASAASSTATNMLEFDELSDIIR